MQNQDDLEGYKNNPNYDQELANAVRMGEANKDEASVQTTAEAANQARQQKEEQNEARRLAAEERKNKAPAQPTPDKTAEENATWQGRIRNAKATDDDIRTSFDAWQSGEYQPGPKTMEEYKRMGLIDADGNPINKTPGAAEQPAEQPVEQPEEATPEQPAEQPAEEEAPAEQPAGETEGAAETAIDGAPEETKTPEEQERTEDLQAAIESTPEEKRKELYDKIFEELNPNEKEKFKSIFDAYNKGAIDKATESYFIADALARWGKNMANIYNANQTNNMWANIKSGNQINPEIDLGPNEWQQYLKTNWEAAQKLKNEGKQKALTDTLDRTNEILSSMDKADLMYNIEPQIYAQSWMGKKSPQEIAQFVMTKGYIDGNIRSMEDAANIDDYFGNLDITGQKGVQELKSLYLDNEGKVNLNEISKVDATHAETRARLEETQANLMNRLTQGEIDMQTYEKESKALDNQIKNIDKQQKLIQKDLDEALKPYKIDAARIENEKAVWGGTKLHINGKIPGVGEIGGEVDGTVLAELGYNIKKLIQDKMVSKVQ